MAKETKKAPDWERIEQDYRAGLLSIREIGLSQGITHGAINKRAKRDGWERDLTAKIKAKADALVSKREVSKQVSTEQVATDRAIIEANAEVIANIRLAHRKDIGRARQLAMGLLDELTHQTGNAELYEQLEELLHDQGADLEPAKATAAQLRRQELFTRALSLGARTKTMKDLADTLHKLVGLEREAYNIGDANFVPPPAAPSCSVQMPPEEFRALARALSEKV